MSKRDEEDRYRGDVIYDVWRRGGNPDQVNYDRVHDKFEDGCSAEEAATSEINRQRPQPQLSEEEFYQQEEGYFQQEDETP